MRQPAYVLTVAGWLAAWASGAELADGTPVKRVLRVEDESHNLLTPDAWRPWQEGFRRVGEAFVCDNGEDATVQRGASQTVVLDQAGPRPIVAEAWSKAEGVGGSANNDYSLYLDLVYTDGTPLWGQTAPFRVGTHGWERRRVVVFPEKPVRSVAVHLLLRRHTGRAWFREPRLCELRPPSGACLFDGVAVSVAARPLSGFQVRDVAAGSDLVRLERQALGLELAHERHRRGGAVFHDVTVRDTTGGDRAVTLVYCMAAEGKELRWLHGPRTEKEVEAPGEYTNASRFHAGANGRLSRYPFGAVAWRSDEGKEGGTGLGIDLGCPAFFRVGYNGGSGELFLAYDLGLAPEKPAARLRFCTFDFDTAWGFRGALARYYELFPEYFRCRVPEQGLWMPFARISEVKGWQDFGFRFKEGTNETAWDDAHGILTFRYTEPMTWWMPMGKEAPRTLDGALAQARRMAEEGDRRALALLTSGYHDSDGRFPARLLDRPWCRGAVWSINSMPGIQGAATDFKNKWNPELARRLYGPGSEGRLDGEYVDSSEGYVTDELDYRREHFAAARTPLTFGPQTRRPAIFRGLIAFEYVRGIERDIRQRGKLMMANGTPLRLPWLAPMLDVMGSETNWNRGGQWRPMADAQLLYRRALCGPKPYCFLMNTVFEEFPRDRVERYMKRSLAYGMFPGFFSHNASQGHYFARPRLYERDRALFRKYVPLCKLVGEAGWEPLTGARSSDPQVHVERFGERYLTVFNDSDRRRTASVALEGLVPEASRELVEGRAVAWRAGRTSLTLEPEAVAVIRLR
ncbi:MAG: hypothetical protein ACLF0G_10205 [Candidatus Brocadiia bacterium]